MADFKTAITATVKMPVHLNTDGQIAQSGDDVAGASTISIPGIKAAASLSEANAVFNAIVGTIGGASYDSLSAVKTTSVGVNS